MAKVNSITETTTAWASQREIPVRFQAETTSTNDNAKAEALNEVDDCVLYLTGHQTKGRGRGVNHWLDTGAGESLLSTWSFKMNGSPQAITGPRMGLAVFSAASATWPSQGWSLKAPNDLLLEGKKVGGLLVEAVTDSQTQQLLVGFGFNIFNHPRKFSDATHLSSALSHDLEESEWFKFLDTFHDSLKAASLESAQTTLSAANCNLLAQAMNANPKRALVVQKISPQGDIVHKGGTISWMDL
jgi:BirA family transcriptional regulator, biotin operon repressor / biotin---[acetyl-CoA-carboxylase] ligase